MTAKTGYRAACACGKVAIETAGKPILSAICFCKSCQAAGQQFEQAPGAPQVLRENGGTDYCLFRKDRVSVMSGGEQLKEYRLTADTPTRRLVASCCNTPMFLDFTKGHWLTIYRDRLLGEPPRVEMCVMTNAQPKGRTKPQGLPAYATYPPRFLFKILISWMKMGFRRPNIDW